MTIHCDTVYLYDSNSGQLVEAELRHNIDEAQLRDWETQWKPTCKKAAIDCLQNGNVDRIPSSIGWDWRGKVESIRGLLAKQSFCIVCNGMTEGMMQVTTTYSADTPYTQR